MEGVERLAGADQRLGADAGQARRGTSKRCGVTGPAGTCVQRAHGHCDCHGVVRGALSLCGWFGPGVPRVCCWLVEGCKGAGRAGRGCWLLRRAHECARVPYRTVLSPALELLGNRWFGRLGRERKGAARKHVTNLAAQL